MSKYLLLCGIAALGYGAYRYLRADFRAQSHREQATMLKDEADARPIESPRATDDLPPIVVKWLHRSGALQGYRPDQVHLRQSLSMKLSPGQQRWYPARADQLVTLHPPAFHWTVRVRMLPLVYVHGYDSFVQQRATTQMRLWDILPVARVDPGPKANEAALQRYLAEAVWYPHIALEPYLQWEALDSLRARATISLHELRASVDFHFTQAGDVAKVSARRYRSVAPETQRTGWEVTIAKTGWLSGIRVPLRAHVTWLGETGTPWTWLDVTVTYLHYR
ncbi:hypothetical protein LEM8419_01820 [Neolewinella maritima]|uniref:DUF3108 domain-containing protein n=1 Tax=Neolewinella maritima TaxID=1383882 RepID=A0ABM9B172_9BACT|nr:DUF6544 family protein [Neolewinella maritima]CAH1000686.1 hypothetical protein LEM8419_01820 [Neolewinella maritima]